MSNLRSPINDNSHEKSKEAFKLRMYKKYTIILNL